MIRCYLTFAALLVACSASRAQQPASARPGATPAATDQSAPARIDLSREPAATGTTATPQPNSGLLMPAGQGAPQPFRTVQQGTGLNSTSQPVNGSSSQFNLGNQKATNTIYYDNAGKMTGTSTSIQLGGH